MCRNRRTGEAAVEPDLLSDDSDNYQCLPVSTRNKCQWSGLVHTSYIAVLHRAGLPMVTSSSGKRRTKRASTSSARKIRYAVIGLGHIAQAAVLPAFKHAQKNSKLAALVSGTPNKLKALGRRYGVKHLYSYDDADELFTSGEIDAVYIALPNHLHKEYTLKAAKAGLHVLCEKPMAVTARDCEAMMRATQAANVKLMIAYRLHFERINLEAAQAARSGQLGDMRFFSSDFSMQVKPGNIRLQRIEGGGPLHDIGVYCINAARYCFADEPVKVMATATRSNDPRFGEADETVVATMRFKDERIASFSCSFGAADRSIYTVVGTKGSVSVEPAYEYAEGLAYEMKRGERTKRKQLSKSDQFAPELVYFSNCILNNREPTASGKEGLADVRIVEAMQRSIKSGRWITVNAQTASRRPAKRPSLRQEMRKPAISREPKMVEAQGASQ
jgi:predicted dehydrogenase